MSKNIPTVCIFGVMGIELQSAGGVPDYETRKLDCRCYLTDDNIEAILVENRPDVLVSFGDVNEFSNLNKLPYYMRKKWIHFDSTNDLEKIGDQVFNVFINHCLDKKDVTKPKMVSIFTCTYNTREEDLSRAYKSIQEQSYVDWEWVVFDDSNDNGKTFDMLEQVASKDVRVRVHKQHRHSGIIGEVKYNAAMLCNGDILIEMDHDDELTENALMDVVKGFDRFPEVGFVYTDFVELGDQGQSLTYNPGWGFGYGSYRKEMYKGKEYDVVNSPNINPKTIRHIVASPNHIRAWRTGLYHMMGGHNRKIHVADDYEMMVRTFLISRMVHVSKLCYIQHHRSDGSNTQRVRNAEIQRMVRYISRKYDSMIHKKFESYGIDDYVWNKNGEYSDLNVPNPEKEQYCNFILE